jgi:6-phosphogluconolactonase
MRVITRLLARMLLGPIILSLAAIGAAALPASALAHGCGFCGPGHVYVDGNNAGPNTIVAFDRNADGTLTPALGSPFAAGGAGLGSGLGSQGAVQPAEHAVNTGSGTLSRYAIAPNGSLTPLGSTTISSLGGVGATDAGITADGQYLYVNESAAHSVASFAVNGGHVTELASSPTADPAGITSAAGVAVD